MLSRQPVQCKFCGSTLSSSRHLRVHQETNRKCLVYQNEYSYTCICEESFITQQLLDVHKNGCVKFVTDNYDKLLRDMTTKYEASEEQILSIKEELSFCKKRVKRLVQENITIVEKYNDTITKMNLLISEKDNIIVTLQKSLTDNSSVVSRTPILPPSNINIILSLNNLEPITDEYISSYAGGVTIEDISNGFKNLFLKMYGGKVLCNSDRTKPYFIYKNNESTIVKDLQMKILRRKTFVNMRNIFVDLIDTLSLKEKFKNHKYLNIAYNICEDDPVVERATNKLVEFIFDHATDNKNNICLKDLEKYMTVNHLAQITHE